MRVRVRVRRRMLRRMLRCMLRRILRRMLRRMLRRILRRRRRRRPITNRGTIMVCMVVNSELQGSQLGKTTFPSRIIAVKSIQLTTQVIPFLASKFLYSIAKLKFDMKRKQYGLFVIWVRERTIKFSQKPGTLHSLHSVGLEGQNTGTFYETRTLGYNS